jgi:hypothetical protein
MNSNMTEGKRIGLKKKEVKREWKKLLYNLYHLHNIATVSKLSTWTSERRSMNGRKATKNCGRKILLEETTLDKLL